MEMTPEQIDGFAYEIKQQADALYALATAIATDQEFDPRTLNRVGSYCRSSGHKLEFLP